MEVIGKIRMKARPTTLDSGTAPNTRLSLELGRLSPISQTWSGGTR